VAAEVEVKIIADFCEHVTRLRDPYENRHGRAVCNLAERMAQELEMSRDDMRQLGYGARLHDAAKLLIPEVILNKPGRLTLQEWDMIKAHPQMGVKMFSIVDLDPRIIDIILHHHENQDGSGYPDGLKGNQISRMARIIRICDTFESMTRKRSYKPMYSQQESLQRMSKHVGNIFDPILFEKFSAMLKRDGYHVEMEEHEKA